MTPVEREMSVQPRIGWLAW